MNRQFKRVSLIALLSGLVLSFAPFSNSASLLKDNSSKRTALHDAMRKLWEEQEKRDLIEYLKSR